MKYRFLARLIAAALLFFLCESATLVQRADATPISQAHSTAELLMQHSPSTPGQVTAGLRLIPDKDWHVYWKYPGDSGAAPILRWSLDGEALSAATRWPVPKPIRLGPFVNYGYDKEVLLTATLTVPSHLLSKSSYALKLDAEWLVCKEECIPANAIFTATIDTTQSVSDPLFSHFENTLPKVDPSLQVTLHPVPASDLLTLHTTRKAPFSPLALFIPDKPGLILNGYEQQYKEHFTGGTLTLKRHQDFASHQDQFSGLLVIDTPNADSSMAYAIKANLQAVSSSASSHDLSPTGSPHLAWILIAALIGGLILNLMPCVFPILSIKILGFVKKAGEDPRAIRFHGMLFSAGVLVSFWLLAAIVLFMRGSGEALGWGFQLQNPPFVAGLTLLLVALALNLFGVFEMGTAIQQFASRGSSSKTTPYLESFGSGVLATVLATPCTAPFMGGAIAYALSATIGECLLVFTALGTGLALPYLILSFFPTWLSRMPRPGQWMVTFKQAMGFPLLLTALWLTTIYRDQSGSLSQSLLLLACILTAVVLWVFGKLTSPERSKKTRRLAALLTTAGLIGCFFLGAHSSPDVAGETTAQHSDEFGEYTQDSYSQKWYVFDSTIVDKLLTSGHPVYVDFTASWCVTCQFNKSVVFGSSAVRELVHRKDVALVRADWTRKDPEITEALKAYGRAGVPLNILHIPEADTLPFVFPSLLTPGIVMTELEKIS